MFANILGVASKHVTQFALIDNLTIASNKTLLHLGFRHRWKCLRVCLIVGSNKMGERAMTLIDTESRWRR